MPNPINPYPQGKSETSAESILEFVEARHNDYENTLSQTEGIKNSPLRNHIDHVVIETKEIADEIRRRIMAEAERRAKAFAATGTEL